MTQQVYEKIKAQEEYCREYQVPFFAPRSGRCWCCGRQIFEAISLEVARNDLITGCPYCHRTYVD